MAKITTDFAGTEDTDTVKTRIGEIVDFWGYDSSAYTTWGDARTDLNGLCAAFGESDIADNELASSFISKLNAVNNDVAGLLFASGEEGAWYEPSTTTCFTDTGGTTPATYGDGVAYLQDLSGNGNHATQATAASRPILARVPEGGRRNLLPIPTSWDNIVDATISSGIADPDGGTDAYSVKHTNVNSNSVDGSSSYVSGTNYVGKFKIRVISGQWIRFFVAGVGVYLDANNSFAEGTTGTGFVSSSASSLGSSWWEITIVCTAQSTGALFGGVQVQLADGSIAELLNGEYYLYEAQVEEGSTATAYQKVVDEYDITEAGVTSLDYLSFDGSDDGMATASIDFTATDKMSVFAGVESEADAVGAIVELGNIFYNKNGAFILSREASGAYNYGLSTSTSNSTGLSITFTSVRAAPDLAVLSFEKDLAGATEADKSVFSRVNGASDIASTLYSAPSTATVFQNLPLYIGARGNATSLWFDGKLFSLIVRGASSTANEISQTETYLAAKSGVTL